MKQIKINVTMKVKNMYEFMLRDAYLGIGGVGSVVFSVAMAIYFFAAYDTLHGGQRVLVGIGALLFILINPLVILFNSTKQVKLNPTFRDMLTYTLSQDGVLVEQNNQEVLVKWEEFWKAVETPQSIIIHITKKRAFILPKYAIGDELKEVKELICTQMGQEKCKFKKA